MSRVIDQLYELRSNFIVIGLTGRTGSGCSTVAKLLQSKNFGEFNAPLPEQGNEISNDARKYRITYNYLNNNWEKFTVIRASDIITLLVLKNEYNSFLSYMKGIRNDNSLSFSVSFQEAYEKNYNRAIKIFDFIEKKRYKIDYRNILDGLSQYDDIKHFRNSANVKLIKNLEKKLRQEFLDVYKFLFQELPNFSEDLKINLYEGQKSKSFSNYQQWGDNIRISGEALISTDNNVGNLPTLAKFINEIIKILRVYNRLFNPNENITRVVIDALRNPYEILFFRERYSAFYTISINAEEEERQSRLFKKSFNDDSINHLDRKEYPEDKNLNNIYAKQHIQRCIELSDIHIVNRDDKKEDRYYLKKQLVNYISLMTHPGIIPPTPVERSMQIAYTAKLNSGCISRQVGAAITDKKFSLKAIGWNNTPEGQTPCLIRNFDDLYSSNDKLAYSKYELSDNKFRNSLSNIRVKLDKINYKEKLQGRNLSYCFKDIYNEIDSKKNQVHTRSLHAEENAFLQITKYGGIGIKGGKLFTTASPCELCAKKAYQIGIKEVYYIDPYPGISLKQILDCGTEKPELILFEGAIGRAYFHLYHPILMHKDELSEMLGFKMEDGISIKK